MIIYRPACGGLEEAMAQAKEFESEQEMKEYIVKKYTEIHNQAPFGAEDISIAEEAVEDRRIGWKDCRYVCTRRYFNEDYIKKYGAAQCIGYCAEDYEKGKQTCIG